MFLLALLLVLFAPLVPLSPAEGNPVRKALKKHSFTFRSPHLNYTALARRYAERPEHLVTTSRLGGLAVWTTKDSTISKSGTNSAKSTFAKDKVPPLKLVYHWGLQEGRSVEGQDRLGDFLRVVDIANSLLLTFDASKYGGYALLHSAKISARGALHVKLMRGPPASLRSHSSGGVAGNGGHDDDVVFAVVSNGFRVPAAENKLVVMRVSRTHAEAVATVGGPEVPLGLEGVNLVPERGYAMIGGFHSDLFSHVDLSDVYHPKVVSVQQQPFFCQMVGNRLGDSLFTALWGRRGGLARFSLTGPTAKLEAHLVHPSLNYANRVHLFDTDAYLPLERPGAGAAVVNASGAMSIRHLVPLPDGDQSLSYALDVTAEGLIVFAANSSTAYGFSI